MALFTLYYERNIIDGCGSAIEKRNLVMQQLMQKIDKEIRFVMFKTQDGKRYKANVTVMNDAVSNRVIDLLHQLEKVVDFPEKRMISEAISLIVGLPIESFVIQQAAQIIENSVDELIAYTSPIRKRSLDELMNMLPVDVPYFDEDGAGTISFGLTKDKAVESHNQNHVFTCRAFWTDELHSEEPHTVFMNLDPNNFDPLEFSSDDPETAIAMMIGHLKANKII